MPTKESLKDAVFSKLFVNAPSMGLVDKKELLDSMEDKDFCIAIIGALLSALPDTLQSIALGIESRDKTVSEHLHALKGNISYVYAKESSELAERLKSHVEMGQWDLVAKINESFVQNMQALEQELRDITSSWSKSEQE